MSFIHKKFTNKIEHKTDNQELLEKQDEMSLIMLLNKIQTKADLSEFLHIPADEINRIVEESPEAVMDIIVMVMQALCTKLNLSRQDTEECVRKVRTRDMGYLWANMEKIDVQAAQAEVAQSRAELAGLKTELSNTQTELTDTQAELTDTQTELTDTKAELTDTKEKLSEAEAKIKHLQSLLAVNGIDSSKI